MELRFIGTHVPSIFRTCCRKPVLPDAYLYLRTYVYHKSRKDFANSHHHHQQREAFEHHSAFTRSFLHRKRFYSTNTLTAEAKAFEHQKHFTQNSFYSRTLLHQRTFTPEALYTPEAFYTKHFTPEAFYTNQLLHQQTFQMHKLDRSRSLLHQKPTIGIYAHIHCHPGVQNTIREHTFSTILACKTQKD